MAKCRHGAARSDHRSMDPETVTPPHGDKLKGAVV
jgi:hypothetical protein